MIVKKSSKKDFHISGFKKKCQAGHWPLFCFLIIIACGNSGSQQKGSALQETYVIPQGIKYTESRAVDPDNPPIVIDIANRRLNIKKFDISNFYTHVCYVKLKHPKPASEGNFLFDATIINRFEGGGMNMFNGVHSLFKFTDDYIISGDKYYGLHCYDKEGDFLYTIETNDFPKTYKVSENSVTVKNEIKGFAGELFTHKNICLYTILDDNKRRMLCTYDLSLKKQISAKPFELDLTFIDANSMSTIANYFYHPLDQERNFLYTYDIKGDTLCRFTSYNPISKKKEGNFFSFPKADIYYYNDQLTIRQSLNDTIYRVVSPNRIVPAYVLNFGSYKVDVHTILIEEQPEKMRTSSWKETDRYILFTYTQGRNTLNNKRNGLVKFFHAYFDKDNRQLYHLSEGTTAPEDEVLIENPIPDALPFLLSQVSIDNDQLYVCFSMKRLEDIIQNKGFSSLPPEQQNRLKTARKELDDNEVLIMFLK